VCFSPTVPQSAAGTRIEPPVSVPMAIGTIPAPTAVPDPPDDPPGDVAGSHGLRTGPNQWFSDENPKAYSWSPVRPTTMAPAASKRATAEAVAVAGCAGKLEPFVVTTPV
jgi:hypothetical protein